MNLKGNFLGNNANVQLKMKGSGEYENSDIDIAYSDYNAEQQNKQFFDKVEQANQMGKSVLNNPSSFMKSGMDSFKNGLEKQQQNITNEINQGMKSTVKGLDNAASSSLGFGKNIMNTVKNVENQAQNIGVDLNLQSNLSDFGNGIKNQIPNSSDLTNSIGNIGLSNTAKSGLGFGKNLMKTVKNVDNYAQNIEGDLNLSNNLSNIGNGIQNQIPKSIDLTNSIGKIGMNQTFKQTNNILNEVENGVDSAQKGMSDMGLGFKNSFKAGSNFMSKAKESANNLDEQIMKSGVNKAGNYISDINKNANTFTNNSVNEISKQMGSVNPFVQKVDSNVISNLSVGIEKTQNGLNSLVNRSSNTYISKGLEGDITLDQTIDPSMRNPFASQMNKQRPDPVNTNQSEVILAAKQSKGVFQQQIIANNLQKVNNGTNFNSSQVIQVYDNEKTDKGGKIMKAVPWLLLGIIGMWTFIFMVSDVIEFSNWKFISENSLTNVASWYSTNKTMQEAALGYSGGIGRNYISLIDFILFFFITKMFYNIWLTNDYFQAGPAKNNVVIFLFLKDIIVIILSLSSGDYDGASGWDGFGYFWLRTLGKISIILSFSKIFFFRLNYFKTFTNAKDGCSGLLRNWGVMLYNWGSQNNRNPEFSISLLLFVFYIPLVLHCIVGIIESTYVLIIWIAILFFLQQVLQLFFEMCKPRQEDKTLTQRLMERQKSGISDQVDKFWVYFTLLYVIIPGVASVSFGSNFKDSIKFHFTGQQLMFSFFSIPSSGSSYANTMTFLCNILSLI